MRIPLIVSSRISDGFKSPLVVLSPGKWSFSSNHRDSSLCVNVHNRTIGLQEELVLNEKTPVSVTCLAYGTEPSITIFACRSH